MNNLRIAAIVVTYNRKALLEECINAILSQTYELENILVINNASTDETSEYLSEVSRVCKRVNYITLEENVGGAGGFAYGIKELHGQYDWIWIMDDDTIPDSDCLEKLVKPIKPDTNYSFLTSYVYSVDGLPMNTPGVATLHKEENGYGRCLQFLYKKMVEIEFATFVSVLISDKAITKVGYPCAFFFIWGDDIEYTRRLVKYYGPAYVVGDSRACHKRIGASNLSVMEEDNINRIKFYKYNVRNSLIISKEYLSKEAHRDNIKNRVRTILKVALKPTKKKKEKLKALCQGLLEYILKRYDVVAFRDRFSTKPL